MDPTLRGDLARPATTVARDGRWVFVAFAGRPPFDLDLQATVQEGSGVTAVIAEHDADRLHLSYESVWAWIECPTIAPRSSAGFTESAVHALSAAAIDSSVIAGLRSTHVFVPFDRREDALAVLDEIALPRRARPTSVPVGPRPDGVPVVAIRDDGIRLGQFLKLAGLVDSGAGVKPLLVYGRVQVNGEPETRRGRQLTSGDIVAVDGRTVAVG
jgi:ribosome-associated protein